MAGFLQATSTAIAMLALIKTAASAARHWARVPEPGLGALSSSLGHREAAAATVGRGSVRPHTCCFWDKVRVGATSVLQCKDKGRRILRAEGVHECIYAQRVCVKVSVCSLCGEGLRRFQHQK